MSLGRAILTAAARVDRKKARSTPGRLRDPRTADQNALHCSPHPFCLVCLRMMLMLPAVDLDQLDNCIVQFVEACWEGGEPKPWANDTIAAVLYCLPASTNSLGLGRFLDRAWGC